jgi:hypothetical protein
MSALRMVRAALPSVPVVNQLPGIRKTGGAFTGLSRTGPDTTIERGHVDAFARVCGFPAKDVVPLPYPHLLAFPLQIKLMSGSDFPFPLVGSVHVANRITQVRPLRVHDKLALRVHLENLRDHPRGRQFDMVSEALVDDEVVWTDVSTYLRRGGESGDRERSERTEPLRPTAIWRVPDDIGRRYGDVSGDRNPIHLYKLTAKMFGFPRAIAHGMWTKARCLAAFEGRLPVAFTVDVAFKLPVLLPAKVGFFADEKDEGWHFELFDAKSGKPHLSGAVTAG